MPIIHINKHRFQAKSLFGSKIINGDVIVAMFIQSVRAENATNNVIRQER